MILKSQSMWFVMEAMMDTAKAWTRDKIEGNDTSMNIDPSAPLIVQVGDYGYEVQSCGGDGDIDGFVIQCKDEPVCKWKGMECIKLENKHDTHPPQRTEQNFCPRCGKRTPDLITIHTCTPPKENA